MITLTEIKKVLKGAADIAYTDLYINKNSGKTAALVYIEGLVNVSMINEQLLKPLTQDAALGELTEDALLDQITHGAIYHCSHKVKDTVSEVAQDILTGNAALIFDGLQKAVVFEVKGFQMRGITEPTSENVLKGSKDSFIEVLRVNTAMIRRRIQSADLRIEETPVGTKVKTNVALIYMENVADPQVIANISARIKQIKIDAVKASGNIEELIVDKRYSIFPQTIFTERPDKLCANVLEGKVGILIDGYPVAYIAPVVFNMLFQSGEDYSFNYLHSSAIRLLRYVCAFLSLVLPAFYFSIVTFHQEMLPANLMESIIKSKESVPLSSLLEVLCMLIAFEILLETGIRLPKTIGQAVSIVGGLVVGEAAVSAKFVSPAVVVVIAITGICGFITPNHDLANAFRLLRVVLVIAAGFFGLYGVSFALILIVYYLCSMTSFTVPFINQTYPESKSTGIKDSFFRLPAGRKGADKSK